MILLIRPYNDEFEVCEMSRETIDTSTREGRSEVTQTYYNMKFKGTEQQCLDFAFIAEEMHRRQMMNNINTAIAAVDAVKAVFETLFERNRYNVFL